MTVAYARPDRHEALARLTDRHLLRDLAYIDGRWEMGRDGGGFEVTDPATGQTLAWVAALDAGQTGEAIDAAERAFDVWRARLPQERGAVMRRWWELILAAREDLALLMTLEQGKPLAEARGEIDYAASFVEWYAEEGKRLNAEGVTSHLSGAEMIVRREPLGVVGVVTPWNFPSAMITRKVAAALAAGCTVIIHPSAETPLSALALAELAERAGFPPGVVNVVTGDAATVVGRLTQDPRVRAVSFTGSTGVGRLIAAQCAPTMKRLVMELGGHAPLIIFDDADLARAVRIAVDAKFATSGQDCLAANRIYVQKGLLPAFTKAFAERIQALKVGPGLADDVEIGPLMHLRAIDKVQEHVANAVALGARLITGGQRHSAGPLFYTPTLLADVPDDALIMREETFGPVAAICGFRQRGEVIARANAHRLRPRAPMSSPRTARGSCEWPGRSTLAWSRSTA
jgi:aspartate-semialdehyde dehydrogenase